MMHVQELIGGDSIASWLLYLMQLLHYQGLSCWCYPCNVLVLLEESRVQPCVFKHIYYAKKLHHH
jgi:predicted phosphohydrolase